MLQNYQEHQAAQNIKQLRSIKKTDLLVIYHHQRIDLINYNGLYQGKAMSLKAI
jgi:hypothetical protein